MNFNKKFGAGCLLLLPYWQRRTKDFPWLLILSTKVKRSHPFLYKKIMRKLVVNDLVTSIQEQWHWFSLS